MIIKKVRLVPFGGVANQEYSFREGLNVLLGPNEAGKSTLINAIFAALFIPPDVRKNSDDWKNFLQNFLPHPHGDTARVEIEFENAEGCYQTYSCSWGESREECLVIDNGIEINKPEEIRQYLEKSLRFGRGTYQGILFARQEEMNQTFERLKNNPEATRTISGLLRSALFEAGGVSLEQLESAIDKEYERLLQNWDLQLDGPRGGRGISNPHKRGIGIILAAYYHREELNKKLRETRAAEEQVTDLNKQLAECSKDYEQTVTRLKEMEKLEDDVRQRSKLEPSLESVRGKEANLKKVINEWPRIEERVQGLETKKQEQEVRRGQLQKELQEAEAVINARQQRDLLQRVEPLQEEIEKNEAALKDLPPLSKDDLKYLEQQKQEEARLKAVTEAMKLKGSIQTQKTLDLKITSGLEQPRKLSVETEATLEGAGRLILESVDWTINIQSGNEDVESLIEQSGQVREAYTAKLEESSLADLSEARSVIANREQLEKSLESNRIRLEEQLRGRSISELKAAVADLSPDKAVREPDKIKHDIDDIKVSSNTLKYESDQEKAKLEAWIEEYESIDKAMETQLSFRQQAVEFEQKLGRLAPLPDQYSTADHFFEVLKELRKKSEGYKDRIVELKAELLEVQNRMPDQSTEELETALNQADQQLEQLKRKGQAIKLVKEEFNALKNELDTDTYQPLVKSFAYYLSLATDHRYTVADLEGALPGEITSAEGKTLPMHLLSAGTTSGAALALRLAMAEYLLKEAEGFLIMDDPLVNLDPERKQSAALAIEEFAREKQLIIATCEPATAELLGGDVISV